jgi:hypothetical protein
MTNEEIIEGNKLIVFSPFSTDEIRDWVNDIVNPSDLFCLQIIPYHLDWDILAPVVQKIFSNRELSSGEILQLADVNLAWSRKDITEIWKSVVKYVQWYNENKNK